MATHELDRPTQGHYWCDGHHSVETYDNADEERLPGCFLSGPFDTWEDARQHGLRTDPAEIETLKVEASRGTWNSLLEGIEGL